MIYYSFTRSQGAMSLHADILCHWGSQGSAPSFKSPTRISSCVHLNKPRCSNCQGITWETERNFSITLTERQLCKSHRYFKTRKTLAAMDQPTHLSYSGETAHGVVAMTEVVVWTGLKCCITVLFQPPEKGSQKTHSSSNPGEKGEIPLDLSSPGSSSLSHGSATAFDGQKALQRREQSYVHTYRKPAWEVTQTSHVATTQLKKKSSMFQIDCSHAYCCWTAHLLHHIATATTKNSRAEKALLQTCCSSSKPFY